jgi:protein AaeX
MRYSEVDLFGVYVAPMFVMLCVAWVLTVMLRRAAVRFGLLRHVWHPALFIAALYIVALSSIVLLEGR